MICKEVIIEVRGELQKHIVIENDDGGFTTFPADESNPNYQQIMLLVEEGKLTIAPAEGA